MEKLFGGLIGGLSSQEPTDQELAEIEAEGFDDLDALLEESIEQAKEKRKAQKKAFRNGAEQPASLPAGESWETQFTCAMFKQISCQNCGDSQTIFSHFASFQILGKEKAFQWVKVDRPVYGQKVGLPRIIPTSSEFCPHCYSLSGAKVLEAKDMVAEHRYEQDFKLPQQLSLFTLTTSITKITKLEEAIPLCYVECKSFNELCGYRGKACRDDEDFICNKQWI